MHVGLVHRVTVYRSSPTGSDDEWGVPAEALAVVAADVPSLVQGRSSREQPLPTGVEIVDALIFLPIDSGVRPDDLLLHGSDWYRVVGTPIDGGGAAHHLEVSGRRVDPGGA